MFVHYNITNHLILYYMKKNIGNIDKIIRLIIVAAIVTLYYINILTGTLAIVLLIVAGVFLLTSLFSFCPLYKPFGISTCPKKKTE